MDIWSIIALIVAVVVLLLVFGRTGFTTTFKRDKKHQDQIDRFRDNG